MSDAPHAQWRTPASSTSAADQRHVDSAVVQAEALDVLRAMAQGRFGDAGAGVLARHVLAITRGGDWPVQRAAMEAVLRRHGFGRRDELRIDGRPPARRVLGIYGTRRRGSATRPYRTLLSSVDPLCGSCDCPDFVKGSLALCKHLLVVWQDVLSRPKRWRKALAEAAVEDESRTTDGSERRNARLVWDPVRPLQGAGDWLARVALAGAGASNGSSNLARPIVQRWFRGTGEPRLLRDAFAQQHSRRLELIDDLIALCPRPTRRGARGGTNGHVAVEPALEVLLQAEKARLERLVAEGEWTRGRLRRALRSMKHKLYPYQLDGVQRIVSAQRLLLADDMGLGKTVQAVAACHALWEEGRIRRGLLVVPASLKPQWLREWRRFSDVPAEVVDGPPVARAAAYRRCRRGFLILNYELVIRDLPALLRLAPDIVVLDEAQRIKNWATKTALHVKQLAPDYRLVLTGTPMENRLDELASILDWVDDTALAPKWRLGPWHTATADGGREVRGARNLDALRVRLAGCMLRRVRQEVLDQLPSRTDTRVPVELTAEQADAHAELDRPIAAILGRTKRRPLTNAEFLRLMSLLTTQRIICNGLAQLQFSELWPTLAPRAPSDALLRSIGSPKLAELRELIQHVCLDQRRKVVVFSQWRRMLRLASWAVGDLLRGAGLRAAFFSGEEGPRRREQNLVEFHDDPAVAVLFATDAGGVGLNLQRAASCCINLELPWNPAVLEQRIGRIHRLGQREPVEVYHLVSESGIEARIVGLVQGKRALFRGLFDGTSDEVEFERAGSFLAQVERLIPREEIEALAQAAGTEPDDADDAEDAEHAEVLRAAESGAPREELPAGEEPLRRGDTTPAAHAAALLGALQIRSRPDGGITIDAPPEVASALSAVLGQVAAQLATAASAAASAAPDSGSAR